MILEVSRVEKRLLIHENVLAVWSCALCALQPRRTLAGILDEASDGLEVGLDEGENPADLWPAFFFAASAPVDPVLAPSLVLFETAAAVPAMSDVESAGFEVAEAVVEMLVYPACLVAVVLFAAVGRAALDLRSPQLQA